MNAEWVDIEEDIPLLDRNYKRCSVAIDILLINGEIIQNGFATVDDEKFYAPNGNYIPYKNIKGWRTNDERRN